LLSGEYAEWRWRSELGIGIRRECILYGESLELTKILTRKYVSLKLKAKLYVTRVRSAMVHGRETWAMNAEQVGQLEW